MAESTSVVTYLDYGPSFAATATQGLRTWAGRVRSPDGAAETMVLREINRADRFAVVETWADAARWKASEASRAARAWTCQRDGSFQRLRTNGSARLRV